LSRKVKFPKTDAYLRYLNGHLNTLAGAGKKVRLWVLLFEEQPQTAGEHQRNFWKGGNKNEFVIMLGLDKERNITWHDIMTNTEVDRLMLEVRDEITLKLANAPLTDERFLEFAKVLGERTKLLYVKPDYSKYDYIRVEPSITAIFVTFGIVILVNVGVAFFIVMNDWSLSTRPSSVEERITIRPIFPPPPPLPLREVLIEKSTYNMRMPKRKRNRKKLQ